MKKIVIGLLCMLAMACQSGNSRDTAVPGWVQNPGDGAVGSAVTHVKGLHFQEELAIARAREHRESSCARDLARQKQRRDLGLGVSD